MQRKTKAWVCVDKHKLGTWRQAEALACSWLKTYERKPICLPIWCRWMPPIIFKFLPDFLKKMSVHELGREVPEIIIAAGRQAILVALAFRESAKTVILMNPGVSTKNFDVVIAPVHDNITGENVVITEGALHGIKNRQLVFPSYLKNYSKPRIAVLLGGNSIHGDYQEHLAIKMADDLKTLLNVNPNFMGGSLIITPSRRTPPSWLKIFEKNLKGISYWIWDQKSENPYPDLLKGVDAIVVCQDSISMASEACITGKLVLIYPTGIKKSKFNVFYQQLFAKGYAQPFSINAALKNSPVLNELDKVVTMLEKMKILAT
ncbi:MAG: mitochondrial fission ELM1 family protein [Pseudomonadota bacterium]|jgi:mitochondrial fission protein ELM1|nr:mitochondrial fission ELM1 family protein [Alphaproteobacteria bacterium]